MLVDSRRSKNRLYSSIQEISDRRDQKHKVNKKAMLALLAALPRGHNCCWWCNLVPERESRDFKRELGITRCSGTSSKWVYNSLHTGKAKIGQYEEGKVDHVQTAVSTGPFRVACQGRHLMWGCVFSCRQKQHVRSLVEKEYTGYRVKLHPIRFSKESLRFREFGRGMRFVCLLVIAIAESIVGSHHLTMHSSRDSVP